MPISKLKVSYFFYIFCKDIILLRGNIGAQGVDILKHNLNSFHLCFRKDQGISCRITIVHWPTSKYIGTECFQKTFLRNSRWSNFYSIYKNDFPFYHFPSGWNSFCVTLFCRKGCICET